MNKILLAITLVALAVATANANYQRGHGRRRLGEQLGYRRGCRSCGEFREGGLGGYEGGEFGGYRRGPFRRGGRVQGGEFGAFGAESEREGSLRGGLRAEQDREFELEDGQYVRGNRRFEVEGSEASRNEVESINKHDVVDNDKVFLKESNRGSSDVNGFRASNGQSRGGRLSSGGSIAAGNEERVRVSDESRAEGGLAAQGAEESRVGAVGAAGLSSSQL